MALLANGLLPASFRGAPFAVLADEIGGGRRIALHQYPGRDQPWAEDMGRAPRTFRFRGFIVDNDVVFTGGPIQLQRALLLAALEKAGPGTLTHPTLGLLQVSVVRFAIGADLGAARLSSVDVEFVEAGKQLFPSLLSTSSGIATAANLVIAGLAVDGVRALALASAAGGQRRDLSITAATWSANIVTLGADATALHRLAAKLPGEYGRFAGGGNEGLDGRSASIFTPDTTIEDLIGIASARRVAIVAAARALRSAVTAADMAYPTGIAPATAAMVAALASACADPADAIRLLATLLSFVSARPESLTPFGVAFANMIRRTASAALVLAAGDYQPSSSDDAAAQIAQLAPLLDRVATDAADAGDDESFGAVRAGRAAIVQDLRRRGATLARVTTIRSAASLPSLRLAQRLYRDPARAAQLEGQAQPIHPLFMPVAFQALAA